MKFVSPYINEKIDIPDSLSPVDSRKVIFFIKSMPYNQRSLWIFLITKILKLDTIVATNGSISDMLDGLLVFSKLEGIRADKNRVSISFLEEDSLELIKTINSKTKILYVDNLPFLYSRFKYTKNSFIEYVNEISKTNAIIVGRNKEVEDFGIKCDEYINPYDFEKWEKFLLKLT